MGFTKTEDELGRQAKVMLGNESEDGTGTWHVAVTDPSGALQASRSLKTVAVEKVLAAAAIYHANDVISESASAGTVWTFAAIARTDGGKRYITKVVVESETTGLTPRLVVFLYKAAPTCALNDHAANTAPVYANVANLVGIVPLSAMTSIATGGSYAVASPSTYGNLPLEFECAAAADDLIAVVVTLDAFTQGAGKKLTIALSVE